MARHKVLAVASIVWLALCTAPATRGAEDVLSMIPDGACGVAVFHRLSQIDAKIQGLARQVHRDGESLLSRFKGWLGVQQGLDEEGSVLLVYMPTGDPNALPAPVCFLPVTDYRQFLEAWNLDDTTRIVSVTLGKQAFVMGNQDGYAVVAEAKHREILENVLGADQGCAAIAPYYAFLTDNDVADVRLQDAARSWSRNIMTTIENATKETASLREQGDATIGALLANLSTPALAMLGLYASVVRAAGEDVDSFAVGARITAKGEIRLSHQIGFKPGSQAALRTSRVKAPDGSFLCSLPAGPYVFVATGLLPEGLQPCLVPSPLQTTVGGPNSRGFHEEHVRKVKEDALRTMLGVRGVAVIVKSGEPAAPVHTNLLSVAKVEDADSYLQGYEDTMRAIQELVKDAETTSQPTIEFKRVQFDGASGLEVSVQNFRLPGVENIPGCDQLMANLTRPGQKLVAYVAPVDEHTIMVAYMSKELLQQSLAAMKSSENLSRDEQVAQTAALLPEGAEWVAFWSLGGFVAQWNQMLVLSSNPPLPSGWRQPELPPTPPVGLALKTIPNGFRTELVVPPSVIEAIAKMPALVFFILGPVRTKPVQQYVYELKETPTMLTEELALAKARATLAKEGYELEQWHVTRADMPPSQAPDGTPDKYFDRFSFRPTQGRVHFTDGKEYRAVEVHLEGNRVVCFMFFGL